MKFPPKIFFTRDRLLLALLLVAHTIITLIYLVHQPLTNDEADYIEYSKRWVKGHPDKVLDVDDSKTPMTVIAWLPRAIKQITHPGLEMNDWGRADQMAGRYMMVIFFWGIFVYLYLWSKHIYGKKGWWLPIALLLIDPLFMAFSPIVTSDMISVLVLLAACYHYYRFCSGQSMWQFVLAAACTGLAFVTKSSMVFIPIIFLLVYIARLIGRQAFIGFGKKAIGYGFLFVFVTWLVLNAGFYFHHSFDTWGSYAFKSSSMKGLIEKLPFLRSLPTLLPRPFIQGFDWLQYHNEFGAMVSGMPYKGVFILNQKFNHGVWYYYLVLGSLKLTIGFLLLLLWSIVVLFKRFSVRPFLNRYVFIIAPAFVYGCLLSFFNPFQQGIRHAMILLPFLFLGIGYLPTYCSRFLSKGKVAIRVLLLYAFVSAACFFPDIMSYSNELVMDKTKLYRYTAEFNYRYSDTARDTRPFVEKHPDYHWAPSTPQKGKFIVAGAFVYNTTYEIHPLYAWLKQYEPVGHYRYVFLLYDVK